MPEAAPVGSANGSTVGQASTATAPIRDVAVGPQSSVARSAGMARNPDGTFAPRAGESTATPPPIADDDPEFDLGELKLRKSAVLRELGRARQTSKLLADIQKRAAAVEDRERRFEELRAKAKDDISPVLQELGLSPEQERELLARHLHARHIEPQMLTEEQRKLREYETKLKQYEDEKKGIEQARQKAELEKVNTETAAQLEQEILAAARAGKIPGNAVAIRRIAAKMEALEARGLALPIEQVAAVVRDEVAGDMGEFLASSTIAERKELWGEELFKAEMMRWAHHFMASTKGATQPQQRAPASAAPPQTTKRQKMTPQEFLAAFRRK